MRLICTISSDETDLNAYEFSYYLTSQGIPNECEESMVSFGKPKSWRIWVQEEDQVQKAHSLFSEYRKNPKDKRYHTHYETAAHLQEEKFLSQAATAQEPAKEKEDRRVRVLSPAPYGPLSIIILLLVVAIFIWSQMQKRDLSPPKISGLIEAPILSPIEKKLLYDYPKYFQLRDKLFTLYTPEDIKQNKPPSPEILDLVREIKRTPVWMGIYDRIVDHFKNKNTPVTYQGDLFEKIREGEIWRLFTPALLHFNLLHIFFNVLWFILLGNQIEYRLGFLKYLFLILATALVSNTAQYLMSGPFFMGLSGIVVGLAAFIFARQQVAPWEGYLLHRLTLIFLGIFVLGMFALQLIFFFMQIFGKFELTIGIANTAHLAGGITGYFLGRLRFFSLKHR